MAERPDRPLGTKAYGSIAHLPGSRLGPGDHHCDDGQRRIATEKARDRHDVIIVQEKLDGSCVAAARIGDQVLALSRSGYLAQGSPYEQHQLWAAWVRDRAARFLGCLEDGERLVGEWLAQAHGTRYALPHEPFVPFDILGGGARKNFDAFKTAAQSAGFQLPRLLHRGGPFPVEEARKALATSGHGALDPVEGAVWRVERRGVVDFLVKWVRPDKVDGAFLESVSGKPAVWNWRPGGLSR